MDELVRIFHGGIVKKNGEFENMIEDVELFDSPPLFGMPRLLHYCQLFARFTTIDWKWKGRRDWGILITLGWVLSTTKQLVPGIAHCHVYCSYINSIAM